MNERDPRSNDEEPAGWLDSWESPAAQPVFREGLRAAFVSGDFRESLGTSSSADAGNLQTLEKQLAPHLDRLDAPAARPEFAADLRSEFLGDPREARVPEQVPHLARSLSLRWRLLAGGLVAAAAAWVFLVRPQAQAPPVPSLQLVPGSFVATAGPRVDGMTLTGLEPEALEARIRSAATISTGDSAARFRIGEYFVMELAPDSEAELVKNDEAGRKGEREFILRAERGALRIATGPAFNGSRMIVQAPFLEAEVVGTVFGVDVFDGEATCLCCIEGRVNVHPMIEGHDARYVPGGWSSLVGTDFANEDQVHDDHAAPLELIARFWD